MLKAPRSPFYIVLVVMITTLFLFSIPEAVQSKTEKVKHSEGLEVKFPNYYPKKFDEIGTVTEVGPNHIIIGDTQYPLASGVRFSSFKEKYMKKSDLREGDLVGYLINEDGKITRVCKLRD